MIKNSDRLTTILLATSILYLVPFSIVIGGGTVALGRYLMANQTKVQKATPAQECVLFNAEDRDSVLNDKMDQYYQQGYVVHYLHVYDNQNFTLCFVDTFADESIKNHSKVVR